MSMPEAAMNKYARVVFSKNNIGFSWNVFLVKAKSVSQSMKGLPNYNFRCGVFIRYGSHILAASIFWFSHQSINDLS